MPWQWLDQFFPLVHTWHHGLRQLTAINCSRSIANCFAMKCLKLVSMVLDLPQFFLGVDCILKYVHLLFRAEMGCCIDQRFLKLNLLLPMENKAMGSPIPKAISNPHRSNVEKEPEESMDAQIDLRASWHSSLKIFWALASASLDLTRALPLSVCRTLSKTAYMYFCLASKRSFSAGTGLNNGSSMSEMSCT